MLIDIFRTRQRELIICILLFTAVLGVYGQAANHDFISLDDELHIINNPHVRAGITIQGIKWALTTFYAGNWQPLTWISHMLDCQLYALNPMGHHWTSLQLHLANTLLLFILLQQMTGAFWRSTFVAALFALHPLHVESVAWVAERKDVLSTFFCMLTIMVYYRYVVQKHLFYYLLALLLFAMGLMAKPMLVTLPFVLLLIDFWPLERMGLICNSTSLPEGMPRFDFGTFWDRIHEKIPFFLLIVPSIIITFLAQRNIGAVESLTSLPLKFRVANAFVSYVKYITKAIWPDQLVVFYPHPGNTLPMWQGVMAGLLIIAVTYIAVRLLRKYPYLATGWFWFLGTLVPVIGLLQVGGQAMADRYTYLPLIGIYIIITWGVSDLASQWRFREIFLPMSAGAVLLLLSMVTWIQVGHWQNSMKLFRHALGVTHNNWLAHNSLGVALFRAGKLDEALGHFNKTLNNKPEDVMTYNNLGSVLAQKGELDEAIFYFRKAVAIKPDYVKALDNLGKALFIRGNFQEAEFYYKKAINIKPDYANAHYNLGSLLARQGKIKDAVAHYTRAVNINPEFAELIVRQKD